MHRWTGIGVLVLVIAVAMISGCVETGKVGTVTSLPDVKARISSVDEDASIGLGCYWSVSGVVYNSGTVEAKNIWLHLTLVNTATNSIRDTRSIAIGSIAPGDSQSFRINLDGECGENYRVDARVTQGPGSQS